MGGLLTKLFYTILLLSGSGILLRECWSVWFDRTVYMGRFNVFTDGGRDEAASAAFPLRIVGSQALLSQQLADYQQQNGHDGSTDSTFLLPNAAPLGLPSEALPAFGFTVQNLNFAQLFTAVRRMLRADDEVAGEVTVRQGMVVAAVRWPRAPELADDRLTGFMTPAAPTLEDAAAHIACSISWAHAVRSRSPLAGIPRAQFCDFATMLDRFQVLSGKVAAGNLLSDAEVTLLRAGSQALRAHYNDRERLPELYRLRADLIDLLPDTVRTQDDLAEAQEDRVAYLMLSPSLRDLDPEQRRYAALALARPAIVLEAGLPVTPNGNWQALLSRNARSIARAAAATGFVRTADGRQVGTGFLVAPGVMATSDYVLRAAQVRASRRSARREVALQLCFDDLVEGSEACLDIGSAMRQLPDSQIVLAPVAQHDPRERPPVPPVQTPISVAGRYAYAIGYPTLDPRMPADFMKRLLGSGGARKRLMPGRVLAVERTEAWAGDGMVEPLRLTTDISTSGGVGGGPVIDLATGQVIGLSIGGIWQGQRGKFAYADAFTPEIVAAIARAGEDGSAF